jgi:uncharacterized membrane protein
MSSASSAAAEHRPYEGLDGSGTDMGRLLSLTDGVFAFALTFLVITLLLPTPGSSGLPPLLSLLAKLKTGFLAYALSFFVIATWWNSHHRLFSPIVRYDYTLVRLNSVFLLVISITSFLVGLLFDYGPGGGTPTQSTQLVIVIYAGVQAAGGLVLLAIWRHATHEHRLVEARLPPEWIRGAELSLSISIAVFLASMAIALVSPIAAELTWIAILFVRVGGLPARPRPVKS